MPGIYQRNEVAQSALRGRSVIQRFACRCVLTLFVGSPTFYSDLGRARASLLRRGKLREMGQCSFNNVLVFH